MGRPVLSLVTDLAAPPGPPDEPGNMAWVDTFAVSMQASGWTYRTITERVGVVRQLGRWADADPLTLDVEQVSAWLGRPNLSRNSRTTYFGHLAALYRWAVQTGRVDRSPLDSMTRPREKRGLPRPLPPLVVEEALARARGRTHTYLILGLYAGLRAHEVAKIRGEHVTAEELFVNGKGDRDDTIPTHPNVWAEAERYPRKGYWFPSPGSYGHVRSNSVTTTVHRLFLSVGYDGHLHQPRHSFGTNVLRSAGGNARVAQELLRHQNLATTALYTQVNDGERREAILQLH